MGPAVRGSWGGGLRPCVCVCVCLCRVRPSVLPSRSRVAALGPDPRRCSGGAGPGTSCVHRRGHGGCWGRGGTCRRCPPVPPWHRAPGRGSGERGGHRRPGWGGKGQRGRGLPAAGPEGRTCAPGPCRPPAPLGAHPAASTALLCPGVFPLPISSLPGLPPPPRSSPLPFPAAPCPAPAGRGSLQPGGAGLRGWGPGHPRLTRPAEGWGSAVPRRAQSCILMWELSSSSLPPVVKQMS